MNDLSVQLKKLPVGCCCGDMVDNHPMYADDIVLLAPSGKGMQTKYRCSFFVLFLLMLTAMLMILYLVTKSQVMFYDTFKKMVKLRTLCLVILY